MLAVNQFWKGWGAGYSVQVVDLKPGHFHKADAKPWFIPGSPATHQLWMVVGGREERGGGRREGGKRRGRDASGKVGQTPTLPANPKCGDEASNPRNPL